MSPLRELAERLLSLRLGEVAAAALRSLPRAAELRCDREALELAMAHLADGPELIAWARREAEARTPGVMAEVSRIAGGE